MRHETSTHTQAREDEADEQTRTTSSHAGPILSKALAAADRMTPLSSMRKERDPLEIRDVELVLARLGNTPFDIACGALLVVAFWTLQRLGEATATKEDPDDLSHMSKRSQARIVAHEHLYADRRRRHARKAHAAD